MHLANIGNKSTYPAGFVCVCVSVCDVGVLWLNANIDPFGFLCVDYQRGRGP